LPLIYGLVRNANAAEPAPNATEWFQVDLTGEFAGISVAKVGFFPCFSI
jgi:hypothetical protein